VGFFCGTGLKIVNWEGKEKKGMIEKKLGSENCISKCVAFDNLGIVSLLILLIAKIKFFLLILSQIIEFVFLMSSISSCSNKNHRFLSHSTVHRIDSEAKSR
jgi:hypothetical protein